MNSIYFFYNIFSIQELILKFNNDNLQNSLQFNNCILFKNRKKGDQIKELNSIGSDLRYILEFLTNTKINQLNQNSRLFNITLNKQKAFDLFLYFSYLVYTRSNFILEMKNIEYDYPFFKQTTNLKKIISKKVKNYIDLDFNNGLNLPFLSDNEYVSWLLVKFSIRFQFKKINKLDKFFEIKQYIYFSLIGLKFILIKNIK